MLHLGLDIILGLLSLAKQIECAVAGDVHLATKVLLLLIHFFFLQSGKLQRGCADGCKACLLSLLLAEGGRLGQTLLIDLGDEWLPLLLCLSQVALRSLLFLVLRSLILECILV